MLSKFKRILNSADTNLDPYRFSHVKGTGSLYYKVKTDFKLAVANKYAREASPTIANLSLKFVKQTRPNAPLSSISLIAKICQLDLYFSFQLTRNLAGILGPPFSRVQLKLRRKLNVLDCF